MRGSFTAGCIRGMERVTQGDSAAVHESSFDRFSMAGTIASALIAVDLSTPEHEVLMLLLHHLNGRDGFLGF